MSGSSSSPSFLFQGIKDSINSLDDKYRIFRAAEFAIASGVGFLMAEALLILGLLAVYHTTKVPSVAYSSPTILGLNVLAFGIGVTVAFFINENTTVHNKGEQWSRSLKSVIVRLLKYQGASLLGNVIVVGVQLALLAQFSVSPVWSNIIGAIVSYPVTYSVSMHFVWRVRLLGGNSK